MQFEDRSLQIGAGCRHHRSRPFGPLRNSAYNETVTEIVFEVRESPEGGYEANALGASIFTQGDSLEDVRANIVEAVECHFDKPERPGWVRILFLREEVLPI